MKSVSNVCKCLVAAAVVLLATATWAESKGSLGLQQPTNVGGKTLESGNYTVRWDGSGDQVNVKIYRGKNMVATVPAHVVQMNSKAGSDAAIVDRAGNGMASLSEIRFGGKNFALQLSNEGGAAGSAGTSK